MQDWLTALVLMRVASGWRHSEVSAKVMGLQVAVRVVVSHATGINPIGKNRLLEAGPFVGSLSVVQS